MDKMTMQRLKELNQLSKEEAQRIQTLRYRRNVMRGLKHLRGSRRIMLYQLLDIDPSRKTQSRVYSKLYIDVTRNTKLHGTYADH